MNINLEKYQFNILPKPPIPPTIPYRLTQYKAFEM